MKVLIFDSGALINLSMNGLLGILEKLKKNRDCKFLITKEVKYEVVDRPLEIPKFEMGALMVQSLLDSGVLEMPSALKISDDKMNTKMKELMDIANHSIDISGRWIKIVSEGEMSCLALSTELTKIGINNLIAIDERTTRILSESPENLEKIMSNKLHRNVHAEINMLKAFSEFRFIRSSELVYVAYKKGIIELKGKKVLEALLYATKFKGAAISLEEIDILKKL